MNKETLEKLKLSADSWVGTPFLPNCAVKGRGVSCHNLVGEIYRESGIVPIDFTIPEGNPNWGRAHKKSVFEPFMDSLKEFESVDVNTVKHGDMLGFTIGGCIHHCGILVYDKYFIHCMRDSGTVYRRIDDATYITRLAKVWRIKNG